MNPSSYDPRLSRIETNWTVVLQAAAGPEAVDSTARDELVGRYGGAVRRYLQASVRDPHTADELYQEFWLKFLRGAFRNIHPSKGKFRSLVKTVLANQVVDHFRRQKQMAQAQELIESASDSYDILGDDADKAFLDRWRADLLDRAWQGLAAAQNESRQPLYDVLRLRAEHPKIRSDALAEMVSTVVGRPISTTNVRKILSRARERFAHLLVREVSESLDQPTTETLIEEVRELGLYPYCEIVLAGEAN